MFKKLFKFWKYRLEIKLDKIVDTQRVEYLANKLVEELNIKVDPSCQSMYIFIHDKNDLNIDINNKTINCKYTGR